jgi:PPOX class probable F420-dependent enzyme
MDATEMRRRLAEARVGHLATADERGRPHVVPLCFALEDDTLYFAVDAKPKRTADLKRLRNIAANASVSVLVDRYEEDWDALWWIRADGRARVLEGVETERALDALARKYAQYRRTPPRGPAVAIVIERISAWSALDT